MQATPMDLQGLREIQEHDIAAVNAQRRFDELPQRQQISELAQKKQTLVQKLAQVSPMLDNAHRKCMQIEDEQAILDRKQAETQQKIDESSGDFRAVQSLTRDLGGIAKRLDTLSEEIAAAREKEQQVRGVKAQIDQAIAALDAQAEQIRAAFLEQGGELQALISDAQKNHERIAQSVDVALLKAYEAAAKRGGGIGIADLAEGRCSVCRNAIDDNRILIIKREAPVSECPFCRRLLIVE